MEINGQFVTHVICEGCQPGLNLVQVAEDLNQQKNTVNEYARRNHQALTAEFREHQKGLLEQLPSGMPDSIKDMVRASFGEQAENLDRETPQTLNLCKAVCMGRRFICGAKIVDD